MIIRDFWWPRGKVIDLESKVRACLHPLNNAVLMQWTGTLNIWVWKFWLVFICWWCGAECKIWMSLIEETCPKLVTHYSVQGLIQAVCLTQSDARGEAISGIRTQSSLFKLEKVSHYIFRSMRLCPGVKCECLNCFIFSTEFYVSEWRLYFKILFNLFKLC